MNEKILIFKNFPILTELSESVEFLEIFLLNFRNFIRTAKFNVARKVKTWLLSTEYLLMYFKIRKKTCYLKVLKENSFGIIIYSA